MKLILPMPLAAVLSCMLAPLSAQYSSPTRDVENPARFSVEAACGIVWDTDETVGKDLQRPLLPSQQSGHPHQRQLLLQQRNRWRALPRHRRAIEHRQWRQYSSAPHHHATPSFVSNFVTGNSLLTNGAGSLLFRGNDLLVSATFGNGTNWGRTILAFAPNGSSLGNFIDDPNLNGPAGMAFGPDGNFYVVNYAGGNVARYTASGVFLDIFIANNPPSGRGILFVADVATNGSGNGVPEPTSAALLGLGLFGIAIRFRQTGK